MTALFRHSRIVVTTVLLTLAFFAFALNQAFAQQPYEIERIPNASQVVGDFVVGPGKIEIEAQPGEEQIINITATNRMGDRREFRLSVEDAAGTSDLEQPVELFGSERGPYSLKDYISFESETFILEQGERAVIPIRVRVPEDAEPGGLYGSVLVSTASVPGEEQAQQDVRGSTAIVSRIGTLFFVTVPGDVERSGELLRFTTIPDRNVFQEGPIRFQLVFENTGSVHLNPRGDVRITNVLGEEVGVIEAEPWFALPASTRLKEVSWDRPFLFGYYKAEANINKGYDDVVDTMTTSFWVLPWQPIAIGVIILLIVVFLVRFIAKNFQIQRRGQASDNDPS